MTKTDIAKVIEGYLKDKNLFLVDIKISADNDIEVSIESYDGTVVYKNAPETIRVCPIHSVEFKGKCTSEVEEISANKFLMYAVRRITDAAFGEP